jgi:hypothetical protein
MIFIITSSNPDFDINMEGSIQQLNTSKHLALAQPTDLQAISPHTHHNICL